MVRSEHLTGFSHSCRPCFIATCLAGALTVLLPCDAIEPASEVGVALLANDNRRKAAAVDPADPIAGRVHWAFQPLLDREPEGESGWCRSPIDGYVLSRLQAAKLGPAPDADPRVLVRRIYFQLIGLPPSPGQVQRFVRDPSPNAMESLVDRLLGSPQFGERWGRHWLDVARYADSNGLDENYLFREAWRYRNWVIGALNADLPFDRFLLEQIAGDLLPFASIEQRDRQRIAAGFMVLGPKVVLGNGRKKQRMEIADEQIDTIGRAVLGLTLGCARCHDHKFDPVPTEDYYALAGIMTSTRVMRKVGAQRFMEQFVGLGPRGDELDRAYEKYWTELPRIKAEKSRAQSALEFLREGKEDDLARLLESHPDALSADAKEATRTAEERIEIQEAHLAKLAAVIANQPKIYPRAMIPSDGDSPSDECVRQAGQFDRKGETVPRGFLRVVSRGPFEGIPDGTSGRRELGRWLTDVERGAGRLTARVLANRIWHQLIGCGLVRTVDNFGRTGEPPSHPELLDYLARELIGSGWSIKTMVRRIVLSRTFAMSSEHNESAHAIDPENRLLWRAHRRRLEPEALRDAMLAAAGQLDLTSMKSSVWYLGDRATEAGDNKNRRRTDFPCRSVYLPVIRNDLPDIFQAFDYADPHATTGARPRTTAATQALFLQNAEQVMAWADATARRFCGGDRDGDEEWRVRRLFEQVLGCPPTEDESAQFLGFVRRTRDLLAKEGETKPGIRAWSIACHAMFSLSRFQFLD